MIFIGHYSQDAQKERYFEKIRNREKVYNCNCSRKSIKKIFGDAIYRGRCRKRNIPFVAGETAKRIIVDSPVPGNEGSVDIQRVMGDFVLWTKDNTPAYQLVSLIEDEAMGITHIFRGEDLHCSSAAQRFLAAELGCTYFHEAQIIHHQLLYGKKRM